MKRAPRRSMSDSASSTVRGRRTSTRSESAAMVSPARAQNRCYDVRVCTAPAKIAAHPFTNLCDRGLPTSLQQRMRVHDLARRAVAALEGIAFGECLLERV